MTQLHLNKGIGLKERAQNASSRSLSEVPHVTINLNLEFLNKCEFHCAGCYVNRRNDFTQADLDNVEQLTQELASLPNVELNEIVVGPTDFFSTENVELLFEQPQFMSLFDHFSAITITSTLQASPRHTAELLQKTLNTLPEHVHVELFVAVDIERLMYNDLMYLTTLESNLKLLEHANILFVFNMFKHPLFERYSDVAKVVNERYNSHLKMNPSFFRGRKSNIIQRELGNWKETIERAAESTSLSGVLLNVADDYFGGNTYVSLIYKQGKVYVSPCFYDYVFDESPTFEIRNLTLDSIFETLDNLTSRQYQYVDKTEQCGSCPLLASCISKKVLASMEQHGITQCLMPKDTILKMTNR